MCNSYDAKQEIIAFCFPSTKVVPQLQTYGNVINTIHFNYYFEHELHNTFANLLHRNAVCIHGILPEKEDEINVHLPFAFPFSHPSHSIFGYANLSCNFQTQIQIACFFMKGKGIKKFLDTQQVIIYHSNIVKEKPLVAVQHDALLHTLNKWNNGEYRH